MRAINGIHWTPKPTFSTLQFESETLNNIIVALLTALIIANVGSFTNRLVSLCQKGVFNFDSYTRAFVFDTSDDPVQLLSWLRGRYELDTSSGSSKKFRLNRKHIIMLLLARGVILAINIGFIAIAIPSEKRLDACSGGDYIVFQTSLESPLPSSTPFSDQLCVPLNISSSLGTVRSILGMCSTFLSPSDIDGPSITKKDLEGLQGTILHAKYNKTSGYLVSRLYSKDVFAIIGTYVQWRLVNEEVLISTVADWNGTVHVGVIADAMRQFYGPGCSTMPYVPPDIEDDDSSYALMNCSVVGLVGIIPVAVVHSLNFRKEHRPSLRLTTPGARMTWKCATEISVSRPLVNMVPLSIGLVIAFCLNKIVAAKLSSRFNIMHMSFHVVRELLGHNTSANPLQISLEEDQVDEVAFGKYVCADGISAHVGFIEGDGDHKVDNLCNREELPLGPVAEKQRKQSHTNSRVDSHFGI
ncbi:unnamed protein product [Agarophyton chilense]